MEQTLDGLNRVVRRDYTPTATPKSRFCYDGTKYVVASDTCESQTRSDFPRGAVTHAAAVLNGAIVSENEYTSIDPLGRVLGMRQTTAGLAAKTMAYEYNASGMVSAMQYPSNRWVGYDYSLANRVKAIRNDKTGGSYYL